jgi:hypothetical protein
VLERVVADVERLRTDLVPSRPLAVTARTVQALASPWARG